MISATIIVSVLLLNSVFVTASPIQKFDSFGDTCCNDEKARLDNFALTLQQQPEAIGYIIFYGGKTQNFPSCQSAHPRLPRHGDAQARAARLKPYLVNTRSIDASRVVVIDGGYRESWTAELWIVPKGTPPPTPSPTVKRRDIRYRKGRVKKSEYECQV